MVPRIFVAAGLAVTATSVGALAARDYRQWKALGEGGIPWGLRGWMRVTRLRLTMGDPLGVSDFGRGQEHPLIRDLPVRSGTRPVVAPHPVPHRQRNENAAPEILAELTEIFDRELNRRTDVEEQQSTFERHHPALYVPSLVDRGESPTGEVAHFHRPQGSMHLHLNPSDARIVVERGWAELHGLSGSMVPASYVLVYSPRDREDLNAVTRILEATLDWATGKPTVG